MRGLADFVSSAELHESTHPSHPHCGLVVWGDLNVTMLCPPPFGEIPAHLGFHAKSLVLASIGLLADVGHPVVAARILPSAPIGNPRTTSEAQTVGLSNYRRRLGMPGSVREQQLVSRARPWRKNQSPHGI